MGIMTVYLPREIVPRIQRAMTHLPVVVVSGMRQTGKSTLLLREQALAENRTYHTLDDFATLAAVRSQPQAMLADRATFDEVQRSPELLVEIKRVVDRQRTPGQFLLSGSANLALLRFVAESLAGRAVYLTLHPMTRREVRRPASARPFLLEWFQTRHLPTEDAEPIADAEILRGGLPPACLGPQEGLGEWFRGYIQTYVERDVRQLTQITDLVAFQMFVRLAALRTAGVLSISDLARDARLSAPTAARYLHLLEASFLVRRVPPFLGNRSARLIKSPKLYVSDTGLAAHLADVLSLEAGHGALMRGSLLETYVAQNLAAILEAHLPEARLCFWHEQGRYEVDFVVELGQAAVAIEVKAASRWTESDLAGLRAFQRRTPSCTACILAYNGTRAVSLGNNLYAIPLGHLLA